MAVVVAAVLPAAASAASLGARLSPVEVIYERTPFVRVQSLADVPVSVALEFVKGGAGWVLADEHFTLEPNRTREVPITRAGPETTQIRATVRAVKVPPGSEAVSFTLNATLRHETFLEADGGLLGFGALLAILLGLYIVNRRRRAR